MSELKVKKRDYALDNLKVILIFLVVFGHFIEKYIYESTLLRSLYFFIYVFHMPLFVFISGYFSKNKKNLMKNIINNLVIPYLIFNALWCAYTTHSLKGLIFAPISMPGWVLWYLMSMIVWRIATIFIKDSKKTIIISSILSLLVGIIGGYKWSFSRTISLMPFFITGYFTDKTTIEKIKQLNKNYSILGVLIIFIISIYFASKNIVGVAFLYNSMPYKEFGLGVLSGMTYRLFIYSLAVIMIVSLINLMPKSERAYSYIGENTLIIFLIHPYIIKIFHNLVPSIENVQNFTPVVIVISIMTLFLLGSKRVKRCYDSLIKRILIK